MVRSIATALPRAAQLKVAGNAAWARLGRALERVDPAYVGLFFVTLALGIYVLSNPSRFGWYNHFVWQADAFLHGRFAISYPVTEGPFINDYFLDIMPLPAAPNAPSYGMLPFPPLPAVLLVPFVAVFGLATDAQLFGAVLGAINVGLAWRLTTRLTRDRATSFLATMFFAFGTVHWYAAIISTTWYLAHVVAITFVLLGITLALDAERRSKASTTLGGGSASPDSFSHGVLARTFADKSLFLHWYRRFRDQVDGLQFLAGFVFGLAALSRLTIIFGAPFFLFVGGGGSYRKRALSAGLGAAVPLLLLAGYNMVSAGHLFNPVYDWLFQHQTEGLPYAPPGLEGSREWGVENVQFIPLNAILMFLWPPTLFPNGTDCALSLLRPDCPIAVPSQFGMSLLLTSPAYLLAPLIGAVAWRNRLVAGSVLAVVAIALINLAHFSQGWVQFGYRFSNDFAPFALILVTLAIAWLSARKGGRRLAFALVAASILVNAWGVYWGISLGW